MRGPWNFQKKVRREKMIYSQIYFTNTQKHERERERG